MRGQYSWSELKEFFIGHLRYELFYSKRLRHLISNHILEQIEFRLEWMDSQCYSQGSCKICGCETTALQCASKSCDKPCYPEMVNKSRWEQFKCLRYLEDTHGFWYLDKNDEEDKLIRFNSFSDLLDYITKINLDKIQYYVQRKRDSIRNS